MGLHEHVAFGIFARVLGDEPEYKLLHERVASVELADSITVDGHKVLNVVSAEEGAFCFPFPNQTLTADHFPSLKSRTTVACSLPVPSQPFNPSSRTQTRPIYPGPARPP